MVLLIPLRTSSDLPFEELESKSNFVEVLLEMLMARSNPR
ncbi:hypothetical protein DO71_6098 [Burkholderia pseudomallei]|nr:hypothetical protein DO71_6098 [Burkholderia pseudomallei]